MLRCCLIRLVVWMMKQRWMRFVEVERVLYVAFKRISEGCQERGICTVCFDVTHFPPTFDMTLMHSGVIAGKFPVTCREGSTAMSARRMVR